MNAHGSVVRLDHPGRRDQAGVAADASGLRTLWPRWAERRRYRGDLRRLLRLGTHLIADIGLEHRRAAEEAVKPIWRA